MQTNLDGVLVQVHSRPLVYLLLQARLLVYLLVYLQVHSLLPAYLLVYLQVCLPVHLQARLLVLVCLQVHSLLQAHLPVYLQVCLQAGFPLQARLLVLLCRRSDARKTTGTGNLQKQQTDRRQLSK